MADRLAERASAIERKSYSAATWLESAMVCEARAKQAAESASNGSSRRLASKSFRCTPEHARLGLEAFQRFGKGSGAKASLNYGDCFVYALAKDLGAPACSRATISRKPISLCRSAN